MGYLIEYFKAKTAENAIEKAISHAKKAQECVLVLQKGINALLLDKDYSKGSELLKDIDKIESDADDIRREILEDISKGELNPSVRMDLSHLVKRIDDVANCANGVGRLGSTVSREFWDQLSQETVNFIIEEMEKTVECATLLDNIIIALSESREDVKEISFKINELEHDVDVLSYKVKESLQKTKFKINIFTGILINNTLVFLDSISDAVEEVADYILLLTVSKR